MMVMMVMMVMDQTFTRASSRAGVSAGGVSDAAPALTVRSSMASGAVGKFASVLPASVLSNEASAMVKLHA